MWSWIKTIFMRPYLLAVLVGMGIHAMFELSSIFFETTDHVQLLRWQLNANPWSGIFQILIPFAVPFMIASVNKGIVREAMESQRYLLLDAHPGFVCHLDPAGQLIHCNPKNEDLIPGQEQDHNTDPAAVLQDNRHIESIDLEDNAGQLILRKSSDEIKGGTHANIQE